MHFWWSWKIWENIIFNRQGERKYLQQFEDIKFIYVSLSLNHFFSSILYIIIWKIQYTDNLTDKLLFCYKYLEARHSKKTETFFLRGSLATLIHFSASLGQTDRLQKRKTLFSTFPNRTNPCSRFNQLMYGTTNWVRPIQTLGMAGGKENY